MKINVYPGSDGIPSEGFGVSQGGTIDIDAVSVLEEGQRSGVAVSTQDNKVGTSSIDPSLMSYRPSLIGPRKIMLGESGEYKISNFSFTRDYSLTTEFGDISIDYDIITFTPNQVGKLTIIVAGTEYKVECQNEFVEAPVLTGPTSPHKQPSATFNLSPFVIVNTTGNHVSTDWEFSLKSDFSEILFASRDDQVNKRSYTTTLEYKKTYYVRARYKADSLPDPSDWSETFTVTTPNEVGIVRPGISDPITNQQGVALEPIFKSTAFEVLNWVDTHESSEWQLSTNSDFSPIYKESGVSTSNKVQWAPGQIGVYTVYYLRVRHKGAHFGWSVWSEAIVFRSANIYVHKPQITFPVNNAVNTQLSFIVGSSAFGSEGNLTHASTDWELSKNPSMVPLENSLVKTTSSKLEWSLSNLTHNTPYYIRTRRHATNAMVSEWSDVVKFTTRIVYLNEGIVLSGSATNSRVSNTSHRVSVSLSMNGGNGLAKTYKLVFDGAEYIYENTGTSLSQVFNIITPSADKTFVIPVTVTFTDGSTLETTVSTTFQKPIVIQPTISSPSNGQTEQAVALTLRSSAFASVGNLSHAKSDWQISTDSGFSTVTQQSMGSSSNLTSWYVSGLQYETYYHVRVRHYDSNGLVSDWSMVSSFKTADTYVNTPQITSPSNGSSYDLGGTSKSLTVSVQSSSFSSFGGLSFSKADFQISSTSNFSSIVAEESGRTSLSWSPTFVAVAGTTYYIRVRHHSTNGKVSSWSSSSSFTAQIGTVSRPSVDSPTSSYAPILSYSGEQISFTIQASSFSATGGMAYASTDFEVSTSSSFSDTGVVRTHNHSSNSLYVSIGAQPNTTYYVRVRHRSSAGVYSDWSSVSSFTARAGTVNQPSITSPTSSTNIVLNAQTGTVSLNVTSGSFSASSGFTLGKVEFEIASDANFTSIVASRYTSSTSLSWSASWTATAGQAYYVRVRHHSSSGVVSSWSTGVRLTTSLATISTPSVTVTSGYTAVVPQNGTVISIPFSGSSFSASGGLTYRRAEIEISSTSTFTNSDVQRKQSSSVSGSVTYSATQLGIGIYYIRIRYESNEGVMSSWSSVSSFTAIAGTVNQPSITSPTSSTNIVLKAQTETVNLNVTSGSFSASSGFTLGKVEFEIASDANFTSIVASRYTSSTSLSWSASWTATAGQAYYVRVRHHSSSGVVSSWSTAVRFTTAMATISTPTITVQSGYTAIVPSNGASISIPYTISAFQSNGGLTLSKIEIEVSQTPFFNSADETTLFVVSSTSSTVTFNKTNTLLNEYYIRARYTSTSGVVSSWSGYRNIPAAMPTISTPSITIKSDYTAIVPKSGTEISIPFSASSFFASGGLTFRRAEVEISSTPAFTHSDVQRKQSSTVSGNVTYSATTFGISIYYIRIRYESNEGVISSWSKPAGFSAKSWKDPTPLTFSSVSVTGATVSVFNGEGLTDIECYYEISNAPNPPMSYIKGTAAYSSATRKISFTVPSTLYEKSKTLYIRGYWIAKSSGTTVSFDFGSMKTFSAPA